MGKKKKQKKKGCLGILVNFVVLVICLVVTSLLLYFAYLVATSNPDPVAEMKKLPAQIKVLPETVKGLMEKKESTEP